MRVGSLSQVRRQGALLALGDVGSEPIRGLGVVRYVGELEPLSELHGSVDGDAVRLRGKLRMAQVHHRVRPDVAGRGVLNVEEVNHDRAHACTLSLFCAARHAALPKPPCLSTKTLPTRSFQSLRRAWRRG